MGETEPLIIPTDPEYRTAPRAAHVTQKHVERKAPQERPAIQSLTPPWGWGEVMPWGPREAAELEVRARERGCSTRKGFGVSGPSKMGWAGRSRGLGCRVGLGWQEGPGALFCWELC